MSEANANPKPVECLKVCETCPWLTKNHGKKHPAGWYKLSNLKRLWNAMRKGNAPGIVCHSSDPDQAEYGGTAKIKPDVQKRACAGAYIALAKHINELNGSASYAEYAARHALPITKRGGLAILEKQFFGGGFPPVEDRSADVSLPWEKDDAK